MLEITIITGRTTEQGTLVEDKLTHNYFKSVSYCELNEKDFDRLGLEEGDRVKVRTEHGEVVLFARKNVLEEVEIPEGIVFIPMGPYANCVINPSTDGTGTPQYKGVKGFIEKTEENVPGIIEILR
ncbi:MAG TPA: tRNA CCA-pyrophosphorylase [Archaeoglobaceae archaeon]|nr:tRNA CCA-pyrophosphorylase [Archaeoglobaceae archaeon]